MDEIVTYADEHTTAHLTVCAADHPRELQRWRLMARANHNGQYGGAESWLHLAAWPDLAVCVSGDLTLDGQALTLDRAHPLPFDTYLELPDALIVEIEDVLYRLNPQWVVRNQTADSEKKVPTNSTAG